MCDSRLIVNWHIYLLCHTTDERKDRRERIMCHHKGEETTETPIVIAIGTVVCIEVQELFGVPNNLFQTKVYCFSLLISKSYTKLFT